MRASQLDPNPKLEEALQNQPLLNYLLSLRVVGRAVLIAAVVALVLALLFSPVLAGAGLLIAFFAAWYVGATREYEKHEPDVSSERDDASSDDDE